MFSVSDFFVSTSEVFLPGFEDDLRDRNLIPEDITSNVSDCKSPMSSSVLWTLERFNCAAVEASSRILVFSSLSSMKASRLYIALVSKLLPTFSIGGGPTTAGFGRALYDSMLSLSGGDQLLHFVLLNYIIRFSFKF